MKSKRAMIERRDAERRVRRELKKNPPGLLSRWFDRIMKWGQVLFLISLFFVAIYPIMNLIPGLENTDLILFAVERMAIFLLFGIMFVGSLVGIRALFKSTIDSGRNPKKPDGRRKQVMRAAVLLFFTLVIIFAAIVCWAQLKALAKLGQFLLS
ncbi:magnesium-transporting ATPase (P-type) [Paenibacillus sp. DS2015]|uniref:hypothetical protein n=1 Tax=Paenibacillus sp. DS2015 TaxID=3373917 RepID=UPI003D2414F9